MSGAYPTIEDINSLKYVDSFRNELEIWSHLEQVVMLIEDDEDQLLFFEKLISRHGYQVVKAKDATEALTLLETCKPNVIVTDVNMPQMSGMDFILEIRQVPSLAPIPVILLTNVFSNTERVLLAINGDRLCEKKEAAKMLHAHIEAAIATGRSS